MSHCNLLACSSLVKITLNSRKGKLTFKVIMDMIFATANFWKLDNNVAFAFGDGRICQNEFSDFI